MILPHTDISDLYYSHLKQSILYLFIYEKKGAIHSHNEHLHLLNS